MLKNYCFSDITAWLNIEYSLKAYDFERMRNWEKKKVK